MASTGVKKELLRAQVQGSWLNRLEKIHLPTLIWQWLPKLS